MRERGRLRHGQHGYHETLGVTAAQGAPRDRADRTPARHPADVATRKRLPSASTRASDWRGASAMRSRSSRRGCGRRPRATCQERLKHILQDPPRRRHLPRPCFPLLLHSRLFPCFVLQPGPFSPSSLGTAPLHANRVTRTANCISITSNSLHANWTSPEASGNRLRFPIATRSVALAFQASSCAP